MARLLGVLLVPMVLGDRITRPRVRETRNPEIRRAHFSLSPERPMPVGVGGEDWRRWHKQVIPGCIERALLPLSGAQQDLLTGRAAGFFLALCCCAGRIH